MWNHCKAGFWDILPGRNVEDTREACEQWLPNSCIYIHIHTYTHIYITSIHTIHIHYLHIYNVYIEDNTYLLFAYI